jgi:peptide/nickel transport system substrate-binding protein
LAIARGDAANIALDKRVCRGTNSRMGIARTLALAIGLIAALALSALADETPKRGGTLTFMIPADAPPSFDGHKEITFATVHAFAPFYSELVRIDPANPSSTTAIVCDLCTELPQKSADGR